MPPDVIDIIVVGTGLAGLVTTLTLLDRGGRVVLIEKTSRVGGNSIKASSGINAAYSITTPPTSTSSAVAEAADIPEKETEDAQILVVEQEQDCSVRCFRQDTTASAGSAAQPALIETLVSQSADALAWLESRLKLQLSAVTQLGGHRAPRTHRPADGGAIGFALVLAMNQALAPFQESGQLRTCLNRQMTRLLTDNDDENENCCVKGIQVQKVGAEGDGDEPRTEEFYARAVVLATGGFASDRSATSLLAQYRPELLGMATTAGDFSTGDGIQLATKQLGAATTDMEHVQVHPTGFVDPIDPAAGSKILAAELLRGVGGLLLNEQGQRFCNELGTRSYVTNAMLSHNTQYAETQIWPADTPVPTFFLLLTEEAAIADAKKHVNFYTFKDLLHKTEPAGVKALARWMQVDETTLQSTLETYRQAATTGRDAFGKTVFPNVPGPALDKQVFYVGRVTPVLHYCSGGLKVHTEDQCVLRPDGTALRGLYAVGEVTGGVHGVNRLAGNSLLECTVFGRRLGQALPLRHVESSAASTLAESSN